MTVLFFKYYNDIYHDISGSLFLYMFCILHVKSLALLKPNNLSWVATLTGKTMGLIHQLLLRRNLLLMTPLPNPKTYLEGSSIARTYALHHRAHHWHSLRILDVSGHSWWQAALQSGYSVYRHLYYSISLLTIFFFIWSPVLCHL